MCTYIYIYIEREREREREIALNLMKALKMQIYNKNNIQSIHAHFQKSHFIQKQSFRNLDIQKYQHFMLVLMALLIFHIIQ